MPKKPRIRASYQADGHYLLRLAHAIEFDSSKPIDWRQVTIEQVTKLANRLLEAPRNVQETEKEDWEA